MNPAYSVILFTSSSGAGYGLIIWLAIARLSGAWELNPVVAAVACLVPAWYASRVDPMVSIRAE